MKQGRLLPREKPTVLSKRNAAESENLQAARIILESPERYQGIQVEWARLIVAKAEQNTGELF